MIKLTLSADRKQIEKAKRIARKRGTSVSAMFSQYVDSLDTPDAPENPDTPDNPKSKLTTRLAPLTRKARGMVSLPKGQSDRELIEEALRERHRL